MISMYHLHTLSCRNNGNYNGDYWVIYLPGDIRDDANGFIYEHRIVTEWMIRYPLMDEVVYHKDKDGLNNDPYNLMIFKTKNDFDSYLRGRTVHLKDGVWIADKYKYCLKCSKRIDYKASMCKDRFSTHRPTGKRLPRKVLIKQLKDNSFCALGRQYKVSDSAVRKWAKYYGII